MRRYAAVEKQVGETPLQTLERFRLRAGIAPAVPLAYAGRLDPMAHGRLLILIGDECKRQDYYHGLDKEYVFDVLFGLKTDTGDVLGMAELCQVPVAPGKKQVQRVLGSMRGWQRFAYPAYSSKPVEGKPLFKHAHEGTLEQIEIPQKEVTIYRLACTGVRRIPRDELLRAIQEKIQALEINTHSSYPDADFRKDAILQRWQDVRGQMQEHYTIARCSAVVSSGTYVRTLAEKIAKRLNTCGLAYDIHRTKIGHYYSLGTLFGFWGKTFKNK